MEFLCQTPWNGRMTGEALIIACSDGGFAEYIEEFIRDTKHRLGVEHIDKIFVPGGPEFLLELDGDVKMRKFGKAGKKWSEFLVEHHHLKTIICIAHWDCGWYKEKSFQRSPAGDLPKIQAKLKELFPGTAVETWYLEVDSEGAKFEKVDI